MKSTTDQKADVSTEQKIKDAARIVFMKKGYAATRTRDIAEEAGINLALLNYYFRSKQKLFEIIMMETLSRFFNSVISVFNDENTTLESKVRELASRYIDTLIREPEIPTFILSELRSNPDMLLTKLPVKQVLSKSVFFRQHQELIAAGKITEVSPVHFLVNMMGLIIFPFLAKPLIMGGTNLKAEEFKNLMLERKKLIPAWIKILMHTK